MLAKGMHRVTHIDNSCKTPPCAIKQNKYDMQTTGGKDVPNIGFMHKL